MLCIVINSRDPVILHACYQDKLQSEDQLKRMKLKPITTTQITFASAPGASRKTLMHALCWQRNKCNDKLFRGGWPMQPLSTSNGSSLSRPMRSWPSHDRVLSSRHPQPTSSLPSMLPIILLHIIPTLALWRRGNGSVYYIYGTTVSALMRSSL